MWENFQKRGGVFWLIKINRNWNDSCKSRRSFRSSVSRHSPLMFRLSSAQTIYLIYLCWNWFQTYLYSLLNIVKVNLTSHRIIISSWDLSETVVWLMEMQFSGKIYYCLHDKNDKAKILWLTFHKVWKMLKAQIQSISHDL